MIGMNFYKHCYSSFKVVAGVDYDKDKKINHVPCGGQVLLFVCMYIQNIATDSMLHLNTLSANDGTWHMCYRSIIPRSLSGNFPSLDIVSVGSVESTDML
jgi:hypothetical protein